MPRYNPFAERAGMRRVLVSDPNPQASAVAVELESLGFDLRLLSSQRYVHGKLEALNVDQLAKLKVCFLRNTHPLFREVFGAARRLKNGAVKDYKEELDKADLDKLTRLVKTAVVLLQAKVYLFWQKVNDRINSIKTSVGMVLSRLSSR